MKPLNIIFVLTLFFGVSFLAGGYDEKVGTLISNNPMAAAVFFTQSTTVPVLQAAYKNIPSTNKKINVLVVPGHEPDFGGTENNGIYERDINADLGLELARYFIEDGHYNVMMTRGKDGWNPVFQNYFTTQRDDIRTFIARQKNEMAQLEQNGKITTKNDNVPHNKAPNDVALRLYGINKWANDNKMDIVIHVHFNDMHPRKNGTAGEYTGFAIYTPDRQYSNSVVTSEIAKNIFRRLSRMFPVSNLPEEEEGIVEDQNLIAVGNGNTVDAASMLIEYGYIYESQFKEPFIRTRILKELAFQTYLGVADFFGETAIFAGPYQSTLLPYREGGVVTKTPHANLKVLEFQAALSDRGFYPPQNYTKNDCPISGYFGPCTSAALREFQYEFDIKGERDTIGAKTNAKLQSLFSANLISKN